MKAKEFFDATELDRIAAAVREVETSTAGEIVVMVVDASDEYPEAAVAGGALAAALSALAVVDLFGGDSLWLYAPLWLLLFAAWTWGLGRLPQARRFLVSAGRAEQRVRERALRAFYEQNLHRTREQTGVLFFLSLLERRVWVLADQGIYRKIAPETLQEYALRVAGGVREGRAADELVREIRAVGTVLAGHFPVRADDRNELANHVIIG